jgi:putative DNA primase/helicase
VTAQPTGPADLRPKATIIGNPIILDQPLLRTPTVRRYPTFDARTGKPGPEHVREDRPDGTKRMWWEPTGMKPADCWYGNPADYPADAELVIAEGEKAADAVREAGYPALGHVAGASTLPSDAALALLRDRPVVLWPDNDEPGQSLMHKLATRLEAMGHPSVRYVQVPDDMPDKGDAADVSGKVIHELIGEARSLPLIPPDADNGMPADAPAHLVRQSRAAWYFAQMAGDRVRFDHGRGRWLIWAGHRWQPDEDGSVDRLWLDQLASRYQQALNADERERVRLIAEVQAAGAMNSAITAGLEIASSMKPIATTSDAWDPDPWLLGCENGVVELRTGILRPGRPEDMISRSTGIAYDPDATCPRWMRFLEEVFAGDSELVDWYGLLIGTSLVGVVQELLAIHHGLGNNGKSKSVGALRTAIGDYAAVIPVETLVNAKRTAGEATPDLMALRGARIAFTSEPDQAAKLRGGVLKRLASVDRMTGRSLYSTTTTWEPTHTVHLATNHLPAVDDATDGFWRRVALVPWNVRFRKPGEDGDAPPEDPDLAAKLALEGPGILAWAVRGAVAYAAGRTLHPFPAAVRVRTEAYRADEDKLGAFVVERVAYQQDASVQVGVLFAAYRDWCEAESVPTFERLGRKHFATGFEERGRGVVRFRDATNRWVFSGARLQLSTNPDFPDFQGPIAESPNASSGFGEFLQMGSESPESPGPRRNPVSAEPSFDETIGCVAYAAHQTHHRRIATGWTCDVCHPAEEATP